VRWDKGQDKFDKDLSTPHSDTGRRAKGQPGEGENEGNLVMHKRHQTTPATTSD